MNFKNEKGAITVFLSIILISMIVLAGVLVDGARMRAGDAQVKRAVETAAKSALADFNRDLKNRYGLFAMYNEGALADTVSIYINRNLRSDSEKKFIDLYDFNIEELEVTPIYNFSENPVTKGQILEYMKYRAPKELIDAFLLDKLGEIKSAGKMAKTMEEKQDIDKLMYKIGELQRKVEESVRKAKLFKTDFKFQFRAINAPYTYEKNSIGDYALKKSSYRLMEKYVKDLEERPAAPPVASMEGQPEDKRMANAKSMRSAMNSQADDILEQLEDSLDTYIEFNEDAIDSLKDIKKKSDQVNKEIKAFEDSLKNDYSGSEGGSPDEDNFKKSTEEEISRYKNMIPNAAEIDRYISQLEANQSILKDIKKGLNSFDKDCENISDGKGERMQNGMLGSAAESALDSIFSQKSEPSVYEQELKKLTREQPGASVVAFSSEFDFIKNGLDSIVVDKIGAYNDIAYKCNEEVKEEEKKKAENQDIRDSATGPANSTSEKASKPEGKGPVDLSVLPSYLENGKYKNKIVSKDFAKQDQEYIQNQESGGNLDSFKEQYKAVFQFRDEEEDTFAQKAFAFLKGIVEKIKDGAIHIRDDVYINEYIMTEFKNAVPVVKDGASNSSGTDGESSGKTPGKQYDKETGLNYEVEYILNGNSTDTANLLETQGKLMLIRFVPNFMHIFMDKEKLSTCRNTAQLLAAAIGLGPAAAPFIQVAIMSAWSAIESAVDVDSLMDGERVPFLKKSGEWKTGLDLSKIKQILMNALKDKLKDSFSDSSKNTGTSGNSTGFSYHDYLRLMLLLKSTDSNLNKIEDLIQLNMGPGFKVSEQNTYIRVRAVVSMKYLFMTQAFMPKNMKVEDGGRHKFEVVLYEGY